MQLVILDGIYQETVILINMMYNIVMFIGSDRNKKKVKSM